MKSSLLYLAATSIGATIAFGQVDATYMNSLRQVQLPSGLRWDIQVADEGEAISPLAIDPGGARFELWMIINSPFSAHLDCLPKVCASK
jgi:hypothetical protein